MCENVDELPEYEVVEYNPDLHDVSEMIAQQRQAVDSGEVQMLPWVTNGDKLVPTEGLPIYVAITLGAVGVAMGTYNAVYHNESVPVVEMGGAFVCKEFRGRGIYSELISARIEHMAAKVAKLIVFANTQSQHKLEVAGFVPAEPEDVPDAAFALCVSCSKNCTPDIPKTIQTCCDGESILALPSVTDVTVV